MAIDLGVVEEAIRAMKYGVEKLCNGVSIHATYHTNNPDEYFKYISFTHRVKKHGSVVCYITYRCTATHKGKDPQLSSYEIYLPDYNRASAKKFKLRILGDNEAYKQALNYVVELFNNA